MLERSLPFIIKIMGYFLLLLALIQPGSGTCASTVAEAGHAAPLIVLPGTPLSQPKGQLVLIDQGRSIIIPDTPKLILPNADILAPGPLIVLAARELTPEEAAPQALPSEDSLKKLTDSLVAQPQDQGPGQDARDGGAGPGFLGSSFDGSRMPDAKPTVEYFEGGPLAPELPRVTAAAQSLWSILLPRLYRRVPVRVVYDRSPDPETGHTWTPENGHLIEIAPVPADSRGQVPTAFGQIGQTMIQQKIERLMLMAHEYAHVVFDTAVRRTENHPPDSAYSAMTEGFAITMEQLLVERLLARPYALGFRPHDAMDFVSLASARQRWLAGMDTHYSEGAKPWRAAYERGGDEGLLSFLASLSARRMASIPRSDPAYQLAAGDPDLLSAYLGAAEDNPHRRGLDAFAKTARGETLSDAESREASAAIVRAGPDGRRRLFERTLLADKRIKEPAPQAPNSSSRWWKQEPQVAVSVEPSFALARLSPAGAGELSRFLADTISSPAGVKRLFERRGLNAKTSAMLADAEALPWDPADLAAWTQALMSWVLAPVS